MTLLTKSKALIGTLRFLRYIACVLMRITNQAELKELGFLATLQKISTFSYYFSVNISCEKFRSCIFTKRSDFYLHGRIFHLIWRKVGL